MAEAHPSYSAPFRVDLTGHAAIVTGGGSGAGAAIARALAHAGAAVAIGDLNDPAAETVAETIRAAGGRAIGIQADVANRFQCAALIERTRDAFGRVSILVNAAGVRKLGPLNSLDEWDWRRILDVNLTGAFFCTQLASRVMADEGGGAIVNLGSTAGHPLTLPDGISYVTSKAGLIGLTAQSARELAPRGIRVNVVCAANTRDHDRHGDDTDGALPANAQRRTADADEIAAVVLFLCSDGARFITGQAIHVDGGEAMG